MARSLGETKLICFCSDSPVVFWGQLKKMGSEVKLYSHVYGSLPHVLLNCKMAGPGTHLSVHMQGRRACERVACGQGNYHRLRIQQQWRHVLCLSNNRLIWSGLGTVQSLFASHLLFPVTVLIMVPR